MNPQSRQDKIKEKYQIVFHNYLIPFFSEVKFGSPQFKDIIKRAYQKYKKVEREKYIKYVLQKIQPHLQMIVENDEFLFSEEYSQGPLKFLPEVDFKVFWSDESPLPDSTKKMVWVLLQNLYVSGSYAIGNKTTDKGCQMILENLRIQQEVEREAMKELDAEARIKAEEDAQGGLGNLLGGMFKGLGNMNLESLGDLDLDQMFNQDNILLQLARDVSEEMKDLDLGQENLANAENPFDALIKLFSDQEKLGQLMNTFTNKFQDKMKTQNITENDLVNATNELGSTFQKFFGEINNGEMPEGFPDLSQFMNLGEMGDLSNLDPEKIQDHQRQMLEQLSATLTPEQKNQFEEMHKLMTKNLEKQFEAMNKNSGS